jgi:diguanylate cyclase (GGDEF)-like protein
LQAEYTIYTAKDGETALKKAEKYLPDLILLDIVMPGMSGHEVLAALKSTDKIGDIPVIFITGLNSSDEEEKGLMLGAVDYIQKPFKATIVNLRVHQRIQIINQTRAIERLTMFDHLTGMPNRRSFNSRLDEEWRRAVREASPITLLMLDVDRFKSFNDTYGHQEGDVVLQKVAEAVSRTLKRPADFAARWGGEEFTVLLPGTDGGGGLNVGEQIRANVENTPVPLPDGSFTKVTVSIGVNTMLPAPDSASDQLILGADNALYAAKDAGRNKVLLYGAGAEPAVPGEPGQ